MKKNSRRSIACTEILCGRGALLRQPGGFEGVGERGVVRHANYESILQLVDHAAIPLHRDAALFSRPRLVEERHDSVIARIYEAVETKRPVVECLGPDAQELDELFAARPDPLPLDPQAGQYPFKIDRLGRRIEELAGIATLDCRSQPLGATTHYLHVLP